MQVWNLLHSARRKHRTQKSRQKSPSGHHRTTLSGYIFATKAHRQWEKLVKQQYVLHMSPQYAKLRPTSGWDRFTSLGHPCKFRRLSRLGSVTARQSSSERQPNFAALNRGRHLCSAGQPSSWALAHISSCFFCFFCNTTRTRRSFSVNFCSPITEVTWQNCATSAAAAAVNESFVWRVASCDVTYQPETRSSSVDAIARDLISREVTIKIRFYSNSCRRTLGKRFNMRA